MFRAQLQSVILGAAGAALAGCVAPAASSMGAGAAQCRAAAAEAVLGQQLTDQVQDEALRASGGLRTRVIPPGGVVTMDHDPMRLNIEIDAGGVIRRMRCG